jgi:endonuclease/exonuclease/phosphatase family metal-dependent hydrolase
MSPQEANQNEAPQLRILTFNIEMLPTPIGDDEKNEPRAENICEKLNQTDYDIICLQELFDENMREIFADNLKNKYPSQIEKADAGNIFRQDSGLFIASKHPFIFQETMYYFEPFYSCGTTDCLAEKGILAVRFDLGDIKHKLELIIYNTHLQSDHNFVGEFREVRFSQMQQIRKLLKRSMGRIEPSLRDDTAALLLGDTNIPGDSAECVDLLRVLEYGRDLYREVNSDIEDKPGFTWDYQLNKNMIPPTDRDRLRLDYVVALDHIPTDQAPASMDIHHLECQECNVQMFGDEDDVDSRLSDHFAVEAVLNV